jgi:hypothetical protein
MRMLTSPLGLAAILGSAATFGFWPGVACAFDVSAFKLLAPILPPDPGAKICLQRSYDARHMRAHPAQKVTELKLFIYVQGYRNQGEPVSTDPEYIFYHFALEGRRRTDRKALTTSGDCSGADGDVRCGVDCDGGGVILEKSADSAGVALKFEKAGIEFRNGCEDTLATFTSGKDDKVFMLEPAPAKACAALERMIRVP